MIAALVFLMGVTIRHFFNTMHAGQGRVWWTWGLTALLFAGIVWLSTAPPEYDSYEESEARELNRGGAGFCQRRRVREGHGGGAGALLDVPRARAVL